MIESRSCSIKHAFIALASAALLAVASVDAYALDNASSEEAGSVQIVNQASGHSQILSATLDIENAPSTVIVQQGALTFALASEDRTATLVGVDANSQGVLAIPSQVTYEDVTYAVTQIGENRYGGGFFAR